LIVVDASAVLELLLQTALAERLATRVLDPAERLHAPHLLDIEVAHVLRRLVLRRQISPDRGELALDDFANLAIERHAHQPLVGRIWDLRDSLTAYDAAYVALAEGLHAPLLTCDRKLADARGHGAKIELIGRKRRASVR
jgi:predicted nucleic acid-binding protein